jgi:hypothetical protein
MTLHKERKCPVCLSENVAKVYTVSLPGTGPAYVMQCNGNCDCLWHADIEAMDRLETAQ